MGPRLSARYMANVPMTYVSDVKRTCNLQWTPAKYTERKNQITVVEYHIGAHRRGSRNSEGRGW